MIPVLIYEALPAVYTLFGLSLLISSDLPLVLFSANIFYFVGSTIWIMRSAHRRTDNVKALSKRWLLPDLVYEFKPFLQILMGGLMLRLPFGGATAAAAIVILIAARHLLKRQANRKCISYLFA